jgi:hypothetical protein
MAAETLYRERRIGVAAIAQNLQTNCHYLGKADRE